MSVSLSACFLIPETAEPIEPKILKKVYPWCANGFMTFSKKLKKHFDFSIDTL